LHIPHGDLLSSLKNTYSAQKSYEHPVQTLRRCTSPQSGQGDPGTIRAPAEDPRTPPPCSRRISAASYSGSQSCSKCDDRGRSAEQRCRWTAAIPHQMPSGGVSSLSLDSQRNQKSLRLRARRHHIRRRRGFGLAAVHSMGHHPQTRAVRALHRRPNRSRCVGY
jgi:hypothetical protein